MIIGPDAATDDFARAFPVHVEGIARLLAVLRREFDGDLDMALILAVIGERHFTKRTCASTPTLETLGATKVTGAPSVNSYSIAQFTSIPRETTRRKVAALIGRGWVVRDAQGNLSPTAKAAADLVKGTEASIRFIAETRKTKDIQHRP
jgi:hypothetical protein